MSDDAAPRPFVFLSHDEFERLETLDKARYLNAALAELQRMQAATIAELARKTRGPESGT